ncbi:hypothetical protein F5144DRAFT_597103 [Chaetomium tenue]|uniref:Uncharacterized protein n=1 Tax=Chaetomium tenue TaxID=1854479 RepID=A0ACB7PL18_9PEZI|nr:hypothetical protein F5144DRAFT_597103 [Chaetomium globosum]
MVSLRSLITSAALIAAPAMAALTISVPARINRDLISMAEKSQQLQKAVSNIANFELPPVVSGHGPTLCRRLQISPEVTSEASLENMKLLFVAFSHTVNGLVDIFESTETILEHTLQLSPDDLEYQESFLISGNLDVFSKAFKNLLNILAPTAIFFVDSKYFDSSLCRLLSSEKKVLAKLMFHLINTVGTKVEGFVHLANSVTDILDDIISDRDDFHPKKREIFVA